MIRIISVVVLLSIFSLLSGCQTVHGGTFRFNGPGTFQEFATARYQCAQETAQRSSGAYVNQYGGSASSSVRPNCTTLSACLAAKGYYRDRNGRLDASSIPIECD